MSDHLEALFPGLQTTRFRKIRDADPAYNCVAWIANDTSRRWWPVGGEAGIYWPPGVPPHETVEAFTMLLSTLGFRADADESVESGVEKVALFANCHDVPTLVARQLPTGLWTSKIGRLEVIEHELRALEGEEYGSVVSILRTL